MNWEKILTNRKRENQAAQPQTLTELISTFHAQVSQGPVYVCSCCDQLWYRHSVTCVTNIKQFETNSMANQCLQGKVSAENKEWVCATCLSHLKKSKCPPCAVVNGMSFPPVPEELKDIHPLEARLLAPRIPFMKLHAAPSGGQYKIRGNVVNVPADVASTIGCLPRMHHETSTIKVKLKRHLKYKHAVMSQNVRPEKIRLAARYLCTKGKLLQHYGIAYKEEWTQEHPDEQQRGKCEYKCEIFNWSTYCSNWAEL